MLLLAPCLVFSEYTQPDRAQEYKDLDNGQFFKHAWKDYAIANFSFLNEINPPPHNSCGGTERSELKRTLVQENFRNIQFFQMENTDLFYYTKDKFLCDMKLSILKHDIPEARKKGLILEGKMDPDVPYWTNDIIAKRWYIAAQSLKNCGIRISSISLTSFESKGLEAFNFPSIDMRGGKAYNIMNSIAKDEKSNGSTSAKFMYSGNINYGNGMDVRGDSQYSTAYTRLEDENEVISGWIKASSLAIPIFTLGSTADDTGYVDELHELYHMLTKKDYRSHVTFKDNPDSYGPKTERFMRSGGKFSAQDCKDMRTIGAKNKLLTCYPERQFKPSLNKE